MPIYEYWCKECGEEYEELVHLDEKENPPCPLCESKKVEKKISRIGSLGPGLSSCGSTGFS